MRHPHLPELACRLGVPTWALEAMGEEHNSTEAETKPARETGRHLGWNARKRPEVDGQRIVKTGRDGRLD